MVTLRSKHIHLQILLDIHRATVLDSKGNNKKTTSIVQFYFQATRAKVFALSIKRDNDKENKR